MAWLCSSETIQIATGCIWSRHSLLTSFQTAAPTVPGHQRFLTVTSNHLTWIKYILLHIFRYEIAEKYSTICIPQYYQKQVLHLNSNLLKEFMEFPSISDLSYKPTKHYDLFLFSLGTRVFSHPLPIWTCLAVLFPHFPPSFPVEVWWSSASSACTEISVSICCPVSYTSFHGHAPFTAVSQSVSSVGYEPAKARNEFHLSSTPQCLTHLLFDTCFIYLFAFEKLS